MIECDRCGEITSRPIYAVFQYSIDEVVSQDDYQLCVDCARHLRVNIMLTVNARIDA